MKKQNLNSKLAFNKADVTELNDNQLQDVNGGSVLQVMAVAVTIAAAGFAVGWGAAYLMSEK